MYRVLVFKIDEKRFGITGKDTFKVKEHLNLCAWSKSTPNPYSNKRPKAKGCWIVTNEHLKQTIEQLNKNRVLAIFR